MEITDMVSIYVIIQSLVGLWFYRLIHGENRLFLSEDHPERKIWLQMSDEQHAYMTCFPSKKEKE